MQLTSCISTVPGQPLLKTLFYHDFASEVFPVVHGCMHVWFCSNNSGPCKYPYDLVSSSALHVPENEIRSDQTIPTLLRIIASNISSLFLPTCLPPSLWSFSCGVFCLFFSCDLNLLLKIAWISPNPARDFF